MGATVLGKLDWQDRLVVMRREEGFYPTTREEQNRALAALAVIHHPGGVGEHLNEILRRKINEEEKDPKRAVRSVVRAMGLYRADASRRHEALTEAHELLTDANPRLDVRLVEGVSNLALLSIVQIGHIKAAANSGNEEPLRGGVKKVGSGKTVLATAYDSETNDQVLTDMLVETIAPNPDVITSRQLANEGIASHQSRMDFWTGALESCRSHLVARPLINGLLSA